MIFGGCTILLDNVFIGRSCSALMIVNISLFCSYNMLFVPPSKMFHHQFSTKLILIIKNTFSFRRTASFNWSITGSSLNSWWFFFLFLNSPNKTISFVSAMSFKHCGRPTLFKKVNDLGETETVVYQVYTMSLRIT